MKNLRTAGARLVIATSVVAMFLQGAVSLAQDTSSETSPEVDSQGPVQGTTDTDDLCSGTAVDLKSLSADHLAALALACCSADPEQTGPELPSSPTPITSSSFPCPNGAKGTIPFTPAKEDAMDDILAQLGIPTPTCSGSCKAGTACTATGILSPGNDNVDFTIEDDPNKPGYCRYSAWVFRTGKPSMRAQCGCV